MALRKPNTYTVLLFGYLLAWGSYFAFRTVEYMTMERAPAMIHAIRWKWLYPGRGYTRTSRPSGNTEYACPETHFFYKYFASDTGRWYIVYPQGFSFVEHKPGEQIAVIFPKGRPLEAELYSLGEFWFTAPYMVMLLVFSFFWSVGFVIIVFKPWRFMH